MGRTIRWVMMLVLFWCLAPAAQGAAGENTQEDKPVLRFRDWFESLPAAEQRELQDLRDRDPAAFRAALRKRLPAPLLERFEEQQAILALAERYRQAAPAEQASIKKELQERLTKQYYSRLERNGKRLKDAREQLDELEKDFSERSSNADEIIQAELDRLLNSSPPATASEEQM